LINKILNIFRIPELRNKLLFTIGMLCVYRVGFYIPLPGVNAIALNANAKETAETALGALSNYLSVFSGGDLGQSTIFGLGIMPYISASIILQLLGTVVPTLEKLKKEGEPGIRKINEWTRYLTVAVCFIQGGMWIHYLVNARGGSLLYTAAQGQYLGLFWVMGLIVLTAGSVFLMWLGEQIDHFGIGNGVSLIITAGIVSRMPDAALKLYGDSPFKGVLEGVVGGLLNRDWTSVKASFALISRQMNSAQYGLPTLLFVVACFVFVVAGSILLTQAQRRIRIQHAKHMRGRRVYGGQSQYLPLRVNHAGVMPIIFASSLMIFPSMLFTKLYEWANGAHALDTWYGQISIFMHNQVYSGMYIYEMIYCAMIFFFSYFWNTVQFQPKEMANQLRDYGTFIPGLRPGKRTADYLEAVMTRITYVGAGFLCVIAVVPSIVSLQMKIDFRITQFLGGTGLLIVISVMLDLVNRIEANLVMRNYGGFLEGGGEKGSGPKIRRPVRQSPSAADSSQPRGLPA
jgi:preprotein translocase subunit SecY